MGNLRFYQVYLKESGKFGFFSVVSDKKNALYKVGNRGGS